MYEFDTKVVEFGEAWTKLIANYNVQENNWINSIYVLKEKLASCYMKEAFTLGMRSTQLSESLNSHFKACMKPNVDIKKFFCHFEGVVEEKHYNELVCEYDSPYKLVKLRYDMSPILKQMGKVYTHTLCLIYSNKSLHYSYPLAFHKGMNHSLCLNMSSQGSTMKGPIKFYLIVLQSLYLEVVKKLIQLAYFVLMH